MNTLKSATLKSAPRFCVGIDLSDRTFSVTLLNSKTRLTHQMPSFEQSPEGFHAFIRWLCQHRAYSRSTVIAMETTGVFGERLCLHLRTNGYRVTVIDAARIAGERRRSQPKSDRYDSQYIADYLSRHWDEISLWMPREAVFSDLDAMLGTREQLVKARTQFRNRLGAMKKGAAPHEGMMALLQQQIDRLKEAVREIEKQMSQKLQENAPLERAKELLDSIPGVSLLLAAKTIVVTEGKTKSLDHRKLANYLGICPHERSSGTSLHKRPRSSRLGSPLMRKLLHLGARSVVQHDDTFKKYYLQKIKEGKPKMLVLNNVENRLLRIMCAVLRTEKPYEKNHRSVNPAWS